MVERLIGRHVKAVPGQASMTGVIQAVTYGYEGGFAVVVEDETGMLHQCKVDGLVLDQDDPRSPTVPIRPIRR